MTHKTQKSLRGALLDESSYNLDDLDLSVLLQSISHWERYPETSHKQRQTRLEGIDIAVINKVKLDADILAKLPDLKLVLLTATGTDNVDLKACQERNICVCNVSDYGTASVAQHVFSMLLALSTNLIAYAQETQSGAWSKARHFSTLSFPINELAGKKMGLVGYGTLARGVEKLARAFDMQIVIAQRPGSEHSNEQGSEKRHENYVERIALDDLLPQVDVLSLHCPLVPATKHLMNARTLGLMKPSAILINTARGAVVDNNALAEALIKGQIKGAGIDVLEQEPPPIDHPLVQANVPNLILTPHTAWASIEARQRLLDKVANNLNAWLEGKPINTV